MKSITEIKAIFQRSEVKDLPFFIETYKEDMRAGVHSLVELARKKLASSQEESERLEKMWEIEREYSDYEYICGVDEVGRGCLAGPVVTCAVILPKNLMLPYVNDSKKLSPKKREALYEELKEKAISFSFGSASNTVIDEIDILQATFLAMKEAINGLKIKPDLVLVDGNQKIPGIFLPQKTVIGGDGKSMSIAAASILAKVKRDREMVEYDKLYPMYDLEKNKGYGTKKHREAIRKYGMCSLHRKSFKGKSGEKDE